MIRRLLLVVATCLPTAAGAQAVSLEGEVSVLWIDPPGLRPPPPVFRLHTTQGETVRLTGQLDQIQPGERIWVDGAPTARQGGDRVIQVSRLERLGGVALTARPSTRLRYLTILCEAPGGAAMLYTPAAALRRWGKEYPAVGHFLAEVSEGQLDYVAEDVLGPVPLPQPAEYYGTQSVAPGFRISDLTDHCLAAAGNPDLEPFDGVNFHFDIISGAAFGGSFFRTGVSHTMRATWMPDYHSGLGTMAHEAGHSIGWPHSGSEYGDPFENVYDSFWDVMSRTWLSEAQVATAFGLTGVYRQTIAVNRAAQGWLDASRWIIHPPGTEVTYRLEAPASSRSAPWQPGAVELVQVAAPNGGLFSVEARLQRGNYDLAIPSSGVVLHRLFRTPALRVGVFAKLIDGDGDGDPADDGPSWIPGETYLRDPSEGFSVEVLQELQDGYLVRVRSGYELRVRVSGQGKVVGLPSGECLTDCALLSAQPAGSVPLQAVETDPDAPFRAWLGDCSGTQSCLGRRSRDFSVTAWFGREVRFLADSARPFATVGTTYRDTLRASALGTPNWSIIAGALPPGMVLNPANGAVTGVSVTPGAHRFTAQATDGSSIATRQFEIDVLEALEPSAGDTIALVWFAETKVPLVAGTGTAANIVLVEGSWPDGTTTSGRPGLLTGRASRLGTTTATWSADGTSPRTAHFLVVPESIVIATTRVPDTFIGFRSNFTFDARGSRDATWLLTAGTLPPGMTLTPQGVLSGTPESSGSYTVTVEARRATLRDVKSFSFIVAEPSVTREDVMDAILRGTALGDPERSYLDFIGNRNGRVDLGDARAWLQRRGLIPGGGGT